MMDSVTDAKILSLFSVGPPMLRSLAMLAAALAFSAAVLMCVPKERLTLYQPNLIQCNLT